MHWTLRLNKLFHGELENVQNDLVSSTENVYIVQHICTNKHAPLKQK